MLVLRCILPTFFVSVVIIFVSCALIDTLLWKLSFGKLTNMLRDKYLEKVINYIKSLYAAIEKYLVKVI
jgi:hypothetical protein